MSLLRQLQDAPCEIDADLAVPPLEDKEQLLGVIAESVTAKDSRTLQAYVLEQRVPSVDQFWELTSLLAPCLTTENLEEVPHFFTTVRRCVTHFSRAGKPKEMVLALLEQVEASRDDALFITLLPCLQSALLKLPVKRGRSLELCLDTLGARLAAIPAPEICSLEGDEIKLLEMDPSVQRFINVLPPFIDFLQPFLQGSSSSSGGKEEGGESDVEGRRWQRRELKKHLLRLLAHPLALLDLRHDPKEERSPKTYSREMAESVVRSLGLVDSDLHRLLVLNPTEGRTTFTDAVATRRSSSGEAAEVVDEDVEAENAENEIRAAGGSGKAADEENDGMEDEFSRLSGACLAYLVQVEWLGQGGWPKVYSLPHLFHANLPYVHVLLTNPAHTAVHKGLALLTFYLELTEDRALGVDTLDDDHLPPVLKALIVVMRFSPVQQLRFSGLAAFKALFAKLDPPGRHQLMKSVLASCEHAGVKGVVVSLIKNDIDAALRQVEEEKSGGEEGGGGAADPEADRSGTGFFFFHHKLRQLLELATRLPQGAATDLLEESDLIMGSLNLLRYLVLRDSANVTGLWGMLGWLEKDYFSALRTGLDMSVGHYQLELDNMRKGLVTNPSGQGEAISSTVTVAGMELPAMNQGQRLNVLHSALTTFDMMRCVLARLSELVDLKRPKQ